MDANAAIGRSEKIDVMAQREPGAAQGAAGFGQEVGERRLVLHMTDVERKCMRGVHRRHYDL